MSSLEVRDVLDRFQALRSARSTWDQHWQDLAEVMLPRRADFTLQTIPGDKRTGRQFDSVPMMASRGLASAIDAMIKPKSEPWFNVRPVGIDLDNDDESRLYMEAIERRMYQAIYTPRARFIQATGETDIDLVVFGTAPLFISLTKDQRSLLFRAMLLKNTYLATNSDGHIDTAFLVSDFTARQAVQEFGRDNVSQRVKDAVEQPRMADQIFKFVEAITPRSDRDPRRDDRLNTPYASIVVEVEAESKVRESGYDEFPIAVPRWDTAAGEIYGRSPGMLALPDCSTLHEMGKTLLKAGHMAVDPPLLAANDSVTSGARTFPGGITYFDADIAREMRRIPIVPLDTGKNIPVALEMQIALREQVFMAFFRHVLNLPFGGPQMTATEVIERREEFVRAIGPVFGRLESDYLAPIVNNSFNLMARAGVFPPPPEQLSGRAVTFEYRSPIERVREQTEPLTVTRTLETLQGLLPFQPEIMDNLDGDAIARGVARATGMSQEWLRPEEVVAQIREQRAEAEEAKQQAQLLVEGAQAGADLLGKLPDNITGNGAGT